MDVLRNICELPLTLKLRGDVSARDLIHESGYLYAPEKVNVEAVIAYLRQRPVLVDAWFAYSEDKRASTGWYLAARPGAGFEVGHFANGDLVSVADRVRACAEFIVREVRGSAG